MVLSIPKREIQGHIIEYNKLFLELINSILVETDGKQSSVNQKSPGQIMTEIVLLDQRLQTSVRKLKEEQQFYDKIIALKDRIKEKDTEIIRLTNQLKRVDQLLQGLLDSSKQTVEAIKLSQKNPVSVEDLVVFGHRVSATMRENPFESAYDTRFYRPPFPDENSIQRSVLYTGVDIPPPDAEEEEGDKQVKEIIEMPKEIFNTEVVAPRVNLFDDLDDL
eukprot:TRINITY_DN5039_c0_g1_i1.p1 TRINITY_DN5039_c0_g1~~TRINITY_DN5039_c0_g1_i1.p1  ORF type:complete len:220 (+),score=33.33 TRINITY_DN5039_c0_g1_i1:818-1477(+)